MTGFVASNGITVEIYQATPDGTPVLQVANADGQYPVLLAAGGHIDAIREFFVDALDKQLGRWRWPENQSFVVYPEEPGSEWVRVICEPQALMVRMDRKEACHDYVDRTVYQNAARAYFEAHAEPKPWHSAEVGEAWLLTIDGDEHTAVARAKRGASDTDVVFETTRGGFGTTGTAITAGRRIWPEDAA